MMKLFKCLCIFALLCAFLLPAQDTATAAALPKTNEEIETFFDRFFSKQMKKHHVPGAGFAIIKDGKSILAKGYGYANLEEKTPVNPETTFFRTASLSKIYVLLALLKLQEEGKLNVHDEVAKYLKAEDPLISRVEGIQFHHLLTHTEGFPSKDAGTFVFLADGIPPLHDTLINDLKKPNIEPGTGIAYGGMGSVLAAHLIETIAGKPFDEYVKEQIFQPLSMKNSTFSQTLPENLQKQLATTYYYEDGTYHVTEFLYGSTPPSGGLTSTLADVSNLLIALMQNGAYEGRQVLKNETVQSMIEPQFRGHGRLPGVTYGFFEHFQNNQRALIRDGSGFGVTTRILYIPDKQLGFVYFQNTRGDELLNELTDAFFDCFFDEKKPSKGIPLRKEEAKMLEGTYRAVQYHQNIMKFGGFFSGMFVRITANKDGTLRLVVLGPGDTAGWGGFEKEAVLHQIEPMLFERSDTEGYVAFETINGKTLLHSGNGYHSTYEKIPWYETGISQLIFLSFFLFLFLSAFFFSIYQLFNRKKKIYARWELPLIALSGLASFLNLIFPILIIYFCFIQRIFGFPAVAFGIPKIARILLYMPVFTGILAVFLLILYFRLLRKKLSTQRKISYFIILTGCLLFIPYCIYWRFFPGFA